MRTNFLQIVGLVGCAIVTVSCSGADSGQGEGLGALQLALDLASLKHDVTQIRLDIVAPDQSCTSPALFSRTVALESEPLSA